ncbi:MAG: class I SAM-dependent methyltransferase [Nitrososphaerales archaeon]
MHADDLARRLLSESRRRWQDPVRLAGEMGAAEGMTVADLGCGPGFFTLPLASLVGARGLVYAVDSDPAMLRHLREGVGKADPEVGRRIRVVEADVSRTGIATSSVDLTLLSIVLHDIEDKVALFREVGRTSRPGALVVDIDWRKVRSETGPPVEIRLSREESERLLEGGGFRVVGSIQAGPDHYGVVCRVGARRPGVPRGPRLGVVLR